MDAVDDRIDDAPMGGGGVLLADLGKPAMQHKGKGCGCDGTVGGRGMLQLGECFLQISLVACGSLDGIGACRAVGNGSEVSYSNHQKVQGGVVQR